MDDYEHFELRRQSDELVYQFDRMLREDGSVGYKRRDADLWIVFKEGFGWIAIDDSGEIAGRSWYVPARAQADHPTEGEWVSKKGDKSYVYTLIYPR